MMRAAGFWILAALGLGAPLGDRLATALGDQRLAAVGLGLLISALALAPSDQEGRQTLRALLRSRVAAALTVITLVTLACAQAASARCPRRGAHIIAQNREISVLTLRGPRGITTYGCDKRHQRVTRLDLVPIAITA